jgi:4-hydroxy-tetrahydrodipicolinate reductase
MNATPNKQENRKLKVMVNGLPGKMATLLATKLIESEKYIVLPYSLTGPEINIDAVEINHKPISLIKHDKRDSFIASITPIRFWPDICIDYTQPSAVNDNMDFYCRNDWHSVIGTTGGDRDALVKRVLNSKVLALIATNMAKPIVFLQELMKLGAQNFPDVLKGMLPEIVESHQQKKADVSGTAKSMLKDFGALGVPLAPEQIKMIRDPDEQLEMGVPEWALGGHGWHKYTFKSPDGNVAIKFIHNVNGRDVYVDGTIDALDFLAAKIAAGEKGGKVYTMKDVIRGN